MQMSSRIYVETCFTGEPIKQNINLGFQRENLLKIINIFFYRRKPLNLITVNKFKVI